MKLSGSRLKEFVSLLTVKGRRERNAFLVSGVRVIEEAIKANWPIQYLVVSRSELTSTGEEFLRRVDGKEIFELAARDLRRFDSSRSSQGIVAVLSGPEKNDTPAKVNSELILALDAMADPSNLGAILRSAHAFGFRDVILSSGSVELYSPKVVRASAGSIFHLDIHADAELADLLTDLKASGRRVVGTSSESDISDSMPEGSRPVCLVIGNEAHGISAGVISLCDKVIRIPIGDGCESLSAPVAAGIAMYEISQAFQSAKQTKPGAGETVVRK